MSVGEIVYLSVIAVGGIAVLVLVGWVFLYEGLSLGWEPTERYLKVQARRAKRYRRGSDVLGWIWRVIFGQQERMMAALDDLNGAVVAVKASVDVAVALIMDLRKAPAGVSDADVESAVANLNATKAELDAAVANTPTA